VQYFTDGNILSILAFFIWIPVSYYGSWRWPAAKSTAVLFLGGLLLLPERVSFDFVGLPVFSKLEIVTTWILIWAAVFHRDRLASGPRGRWFRACVGALLVGSVVTVVLNTDAYSVGLFQVPGHRPYDAVNAVLVALLTVVAPFYLGAAMFRTSQDLRLLLMSVVIAALLYTPLQYLEMIVSPQLHRWVYGFHQHSFLQTMRGEGYRPMVFMKHGLAVALFTMLAAVAAAGLQKGKVRIAGIAAGWVMVYLFLTLAMSRSLAALLYGLVAVPLVLFTPSRFQALTATALAAMLLLYPVARANELIPVERVEAWVEDNYGAERADSLTFRLIHETPLLERAMKRPWFGWGGYCRACVYKPWSDKSSPESVRDGGWIIRLGDHGIVGFASAFGLLLIPLLLLLRRFKYIHGESNRRLLAVLGLMVGLATFDLIPNGDFTRLAFVLSGALWGCTTGILHESALLLVRRRLARLAAARKAIKAESEPKGLVVWQPRRN
jgi:hypothetical protein